jgi:hypothetical protein
MVWVRAGGHGFHRHSRYFFLGGVLTVSVTVVFGWLFAVDFLTNFPLIALRLIFLVPMVSPPSRTTAELERAHLNRAPGQLRRLYQI